MKKLKVKVRKIALIVALATGTIAFYAFDLGEYLTLSYIKTYQGKFADLYVAHQIPVILAYAAVYIIATALSVPGAAIMTLAGGALFGLVIGTLVVSVSSTIGATISCVVSRYILRDWVQKRFGDRLTTINEGIRKEGAFYLFTLRLVPIFPFWLINILSGLTTIPIRTYFWVSQIGMLPATIVYVNAGREIARIESLSGILSPGLIMSFVILGIFPVAVKKLLSLRRKEDTPGPQ